MKKFAYAALVLACLFGCKQRTRQAAGTEEEMPEAPAALDSAAAVKASKALPQEPVFDIVTSAGTIRVKLYKDTPRHRDNFEKLALSGYYDNLLFHRVINHFMIQGGDPFTKDTTKMDLWGQGGPEYTIPAEMRDADGAPLHRHKKGALAAARRGDLANPFKESSGSQFYLVQDADACLHLDGEYTVFGETVAGINVIDKIAAARTDRYDRPLQDIRIISVRPNKKLNEEALETESGTDLAVENTE